MRICLATEASSSRSESSENPDEPGVAATVQVLLADVAIGDERAFEQLYDVLAVPLFELVTRIVRERAQAEQVAQEILVEVWRTAPRYRPEQGCALAWVLNLAHRQLVYRVRSAHTSTNRDATKPTSTVKTVLSDRRR